jgi:hypothetical protein
MNRALIIASLSGSFLVYGAVINLYDTLLMFMFFGILPGGINRVSADQMFLMYEIIGLALSAYLIIRSVRFIVPRVKRTLEPQPTTTRRRARA